MMNDGQIRRIVQVCLAEMRDDLVRGDSGGQNDHNGLRAADALINALERQDLVIIEKGVRHEDLWDYLAPPGDHYGPDDL